MRESAVLVDEVLLRLDTMKADDCSRGVLSFIVYGYRFLAPIWLH